jgi:AcrR family transcriptional regulator
MERNKEKTKKKILQTFGHMLANTGFNSIGINAIAKEANVDKVLIYRYFGGLPGLLTAFTHETDYWPGVEDLINGLDQGVESMPKSELAKFMYLNFCRYIREHPLTQEMLRWEIVEKNELTDILDNFREHEARKVMQLFENIREFDANALVTLMAAGITYLVLRMRNTRYYNGIDLHSDDGWSRIEKTASFIFDSAFQDTEKKLE